MQTSVADRSSQKLAFKYFGPYKVLARVGSVAYRLELPPSSMIHPVFHVSQLKKAVGARHTVTTTLPPVSAQWSIPERILQRRQLPRGKKFIQQGLIKWSNLPVSLATWEDLESLRQQLPRANLWLQHGAQERGNVSATSADNNQTQSSDGPKEERPKRPRTGNTCYTGPEWASK